MKPPADTAFIRVQAVSALYPAPAARAHRLCKHVIPQLCDDLDMVRAILKDVEWSGDRGWGPPCCPLCEGFDPDQLGQYAGYPKVQGLTGHRHYCELHRQLKAGTT